MSDQLSSAGTDHITVCVCTYRRPSLLARLLEALEQQTVDGTFSFDVVVVDNDGNRSSLEVVQTFARRGHLVISYDCEPERSISLARNRAVRAATGRFVAFIDDDEAPVADWLVLLYRYQREFNWQGVLGPVLPQFAPGAPPWLVRGRFFDRPRHRSGTPISASDARTGNLLLDRSLFREEEVWFDPAFGRSGGEDSDFFARQFARGHRFVWCDEAVAHEVVPPDRWTPAFHIRRLWRAGTIDGEWIREGRIPGPSVVLRNALVLSAGAPLLPLTFLLPKQIRVRCLQKMAYCGGLVTASCGVTFLRNRE